jgi:hypothetical protein
MSSQKDKAPEKLEDDAEQSKRFIELAKEVEATEKSEKFDDVFIRFVKNPIRKDEKPNKP